MFKTIKAYLGVKEVGGIANPPPINVLSGDWTQWLPSHEPQKYKFDTDECSQLSGISCIETYCNWLKATNQWPKDALDWFTANGYFDASGSFAFSEMFTGILDGTSINGNIAQNFWKCIQQYGLLPRADLCYTLARSQQFNTQQEQDNDYYSPKNITPAMRAKALQSLTYFGIGWGWVGDSNRSLGFSTYQNALKTAPVQLIIPIPNPTELWNQVYVPYTGGTALQHCVCLYKVDLNQVDPFLIFDQYEPYEKQLPISYFMGTALQGIIVPKVETEKAVIVPTTQGNSFWPQWITFIIEHIKWW